jgi:hypothetical protein
MADLLMIGSLPDGFWYPRSFIRVVELGLVELEPWHLLEGAFAAVRRYVEGRVAQCSGTTWTEVAEQLARLGYWEFEDYA